MTFISAQSGWSIMITTHNRWPDLHHTLEKLRELDPPAEEIIVCADGCTDETTLELPRRFPGVRLLVNPARHGSIPSRDRMLRLARHELVLSLDDDSHPVETNFLPLAAQRFQADSRLAVLWFPQRSEEFPASLVQTDFGPDVRTASYSSSGAALRRSAYKSLQGYATIFGHAYEEPDYALQCHAAGWHVQQHTGLTIRHYYSGRNRNEMRTHHLHARNEFWSVLLRCPTPWWPFVALRRSIGQFVYACRRGPSWVIREPIWWWAALKGASTAWGSRKAVRWKTYCRWQKLLRTPAPLDMSL
jgi:GT2 family glycosyltransferase